VRSAGSVHGSNGPIRRGSGRKHFFEMSFGPLAGPIKSYCDIETLYWLTSAWVRSLRASGAVSPLALRTYWYV
jgi:hypothetical protein